MPCPADGTKRRAERRTNARSHPGAEAGRRGHDSARRPHRSHHGVRNGRADAANRFLPPGAPSASAAEFPSISCRGDGCRSVVQRAVHQDCCVLAMGESALAEGVAVCVCENPCAACGDGSYLFLHGHLSASAVSSQRKVSRWQLEASADSRSAAIFSSSIRRSRRPHGDHGCAVDQRHVGAASSARPAASPLLLGRGRREARDPRENTMRRRLVNSEKCAGGRVCERSSLGARRSPVHRERIVEYRPADRVMTLIPCAPVLLGRRRSTRTHSRSFHPEGFSQRREEVAAH